MKIYLAAFFVLALIAPPTRTQEQSPPLETEHAFRPLPDLDLVRGATNGTIVLWSGSLFKDIAPELSVFLEIEDLASEVDQRAESIRLAYQADRNYDLARLRLGALWVRAMRQDGFDAAALGRVFLLRFQLALDAGDWRDFNRVDGPGAFSALYFSFVEDPKRIFIEGGAGIREEFERSAAMIALREQAREKRGGMASEPRTADQVAIQDYIEEHFGTAGPELRELAEQALFTDDVVRMRAMGPKATGVVAAAILAQLQGPADEDLWHPDSQRQSFKLLMQIDQPKALRLFVDWFDVASTTWRGQVYSGCSRIVLKWLPTPPGDLDRERVGSKLWDPTWLELVERFLSEPTLRIAALGEAADLAEMDGLNVGLREQLGEYLRTGDRPLAGAVLGALDAGGRVLSAIPALVEGTRSKIPDIRQAAGWKLVEWAAFPEARGLASHADPELRVAAATAMGRLGANLRTVGGQFTGKKAMWAPIGLEDLHRIEALLDDPVERVREAMASVLNEALGERGSLLTPAPGTLEAWLHSPRPELRRIGLRWIESDDSAQSETWIRELLSDPNPGVRRDMVNRVWSGQSWTENQLIAVLSAAVVDPSEQVRVAADLYLGDTTSGSHAISSYDEGRVLASVLPLRQTVTPAPPVVGGYRQVSWPEYARLLGIDPQERPGLLEFGIDFGLAGLVAEQLSPLSVISNEETGAGYSVIRNLTLERRLALQQLDLKTVDPRANPVPLGNLEYFIDRSVFVPAFDLELLERGLQQPDPNAAWLLDALWLNARAKQYIELKRRVFLNPELPFELRCVAGESLDLETLEGGMQAFWQLFREVGELDLESLASLGAIAKRQPSSNQMLLMASETLRDPSALRAFADRAFVLGNKQAFEAAEMLLDRLLMSRTRRTGGSKSCLYAVLKTLEQGGLDEHTQSLVVQAALSQNYAIAAIEVMGSVPTERFLRALLDLVDEGSLDTRGWAANALGEYATDEAYEGLRERLDTAPSDVRSVMLESLDRMQKVRELLSGFDDAPLPERVAATAELVELLDAELPAARAAAALGLGRFGAPEALPRLIRMLSTEQDPKVLAALDAAIEMLVAIR